MLNVEKLNLHRRNTENEIISRLENKEKKFLINRPCSYGKTWIITDLCYKLKGVKLIVVPTNALKGHLKRYKDKLNNNTFITTYASLLHKTSEDFINLYKNIDFLFLDEVHRVGAKQWGKQVQLLEQTFPDCQIVGFSATPTRTDGKDVLSSIFDNKQITPLYLADAILQDLLPNPCYVTSLYTINDFSKNEIEKVRLSNAIGIEEKSLLIDEISSDMINYEKLINIPNILQKYILLFCEYRKNMKFIVFLRSVEEIQETKTLVSNWFLEAFKDTGLNKHINIYDVNYTRSRRDNQNITDKFEKNDNDNDIDIILSVNMFNEGLHLDGISGGIFLRKTKSDIVYFQQLGRELNTNGKNTVIFDFVNNCNYVGDGYVRIIKDSLINNNIHINDDDNIIKTVSGDIINIHDESKNLIEILKNAQAKYEKERKLGYLTQQQKDYIIENAGEESIKKMANFLKIKKRLVEIFCEENNLPIKGANINLLTKEQKNIIEQNQNKTAFQINKEYNIPKTLIYAYCKIKKIKLPYDKEEILLSDNEKEYIRKNYKIKTVSQLGKELNRDSHTIKNFMKLENLELAQWEDTLTSKERDVIDKYIDFPFSIVKEILIREGYIGTIPSESLGKYIKKRKAEKLVCNGEIKDITVFSNIKIDFIQGLSEEDISQKYLIKIEIVKEILDGNIELEDSLNINIFTDEEIKFVYNFCKNTKRTASILRITHESVLNKLRSFNYLEEDLTDEDKVYIDNRYDKESTKIISKILKKKEKLIIKYCEKKKYSYYSGIKNKFKTRRDTI